MTFSNGKLSGKEHEQKKKKKKIKFSFILLFTTLHCHVFFFRNTRNSTFCPRGDTVTDGLHQGFVGSLYKAQISQYAVLVVIEPLTAITVEQKWVI